MTKQQLEQFKKWYHQYVAGFYGDDKIVNENIRLKEDHTRRMFDDVLLIAGRLNLNDEQMMFAQTAVLFHDVGRFEQFIKYGSYSDVGTVNHSLLGLKVLEENKILDCLSRAERKFIEDAIRFHGDKELPGGLDEQTELIAKLVRDIDKLDIYYVMINWLDDLRKNPKKNVKTMGLSSKDEYSQHIIQAVLNNKTIAYKDFKTLSDMVIGQLGWITDVNFAQTLKEIKKRKLLEQLAQFLPDTEDIRQVIKHVHRQLETRISQD